MVKPRDNRTMSRREWMKHGTVAALSSLVAGQGDNAAAMTQQAPTPQSFLIRNATLLTMDPSLGDISGGDVLIRDGEIAAVEPNLRATADEVIDGENCIVLPGFIDGHRHLWQTALRNYNEVWGYDQYFTEGLGRYAVCYTPEDMRVSAYAGGLEALNAGVTTVVDFCHNPRTPEHMEAALKGTVDSGVSGYFCYSLGTTPSHGPGDTVDLSRSDDLPAGDSDWRLDHGAALKKTHFSDPANLKLGVATSYLEVLAPFNPGLARKEIEYARDLKADLITIHVHNFDEFRLVPFLEDGGLLTENMLFAHANGVTPKELDTLAARSVSVAVTPETEIAYGEFPAYGEACARGVDTSLGADSAIFNGTDMFVAMRITLQMQRYREATRGDDGSSITQTRDLLEAGTIGGAKAVGIDARVGSITPGKQADLLLIAAGSIHHQPVSDAVATVVFNTGVSDVTDVWVAGKRVKQNGALVGVDWPATARSLTASRDRIVG